jgi:Asp-tRNA(Asn)/Glu-tRNA(Gln) amidotransferase A subunit family amidase
MYKKTTHVLRRALCGRSAAGLVLALSAAAALAQNDSFQVEEATIADMHHAIQAGATTCKETIQAYVDRARAYNGMCTKLVTQEGARVAPGKGTVRAGVPLKFPSSTVPITKVLPNFAQYKGLPIEYGRMESTQSDPSVQQQYGMVVGVPDAGQINALATLNLRGERSVTCKARCDLHPAKGPLPKSCPQICESFRQQPDALERAAELDAQYGRNPDLEKLPMYCVAMSFKDAFDTKDMRSTSGADVSYAMDAAPADSTVAARLRDKGAIIYAKANLAEYNGGGGNPGGAKATSKVFGTGSRSAWAGVACNPYDTARETGGSSSGSAAGVGANLVNCSICEETGGSCRQPAWRNGIVGFMTTKGLIPYGGAIGGDPYVDRAGIHCRTVKDAARVLDALKASEHGSFDPRDIYTAVPGALMPKEPYASFAVDQDLSKGGNKPLAGVRIGIVREYMVKHTANDAAVSDRVNEEVKRVLHDQLGAELVESLDPMYPDDPSIPNMTYSFQQALAEILPLHMPEYLQSKKDGKFVFAVAGHDVTSRDYLVDLAEGAATLSDKLNLRSINEFPSSASFSFHMAQYLRRRDDERVKDWMSLNANSKHFEEERQVAMKNWEGKLNIVSDGMTQHMKMRDVMRMVIFKVMYQNHIDAFVNPTITIPPAKNGYASQPAVNDRPLGRFPTSANVGFPEITVPAGFNNIVYEPEFALNDAKDDYITVANDTRQSLLESPLPFGISFWGGPGDEPTVLKIASIYEQATKHRAPPPAFGPVKRKSPSH